MVMSGRVTRTPQPQNGADEMTTEAMASDATECEECGAAIAEGVADEDCPLCPACFDRAFFVCEGCECQTDRGDEHASRKGLCQSCGEAKDEEELDAAKDDLDALVDAIKDADDVKAIRRAIAALKRLKK